MSKQNQQVARGRPPSARLHLESLEDRAVPAAFTAGNLVVYRVGDGSDSLVNSGNTVFLDEYETDGDLVQSIALPTTVSGSNQQLIASGTATSEGLLTLSTDGRYLLLTGYARDLGVPGNISGTLSAAVPRTIGRVDANGTIDTSTAFTDFSDVASPRGVASTDGTDLWLTGGSGGVRYAQIGDSTSTQLATTATNFRGVAIFDGQLYASSQTGSFRLSTIGTGTPTTSGQTITNLPGFATNGSPHGFFFADLDSGVSGVDTLYVADDSANEIQKFSLVSGSWAGNGIINASDVHGLTGTVSGTNVVLYGTASGNLYTFTDTAGYNTTVSGSVATIKTAAASTAFRGVAFVPVAAGGNSAPEGADSTLTTQEDGEYIFTASDFGFTDPNDSPADNLLAVKITTLPSLGALTNNGTSVTADEFIPIADINGGMLKYHPAPNAFGSGYTSFTFRVQDDGGTANGGVDLDATANAISFNVTPVADTPSVTNATTNEGTQTSSGLVITPNPVDSTEVTHYKITGITNGTLFRNDGTTAIVNDEFITVTQGNAGLKFTPANNFFGTGSFNVQGAVGNTGTGLSSAATATIIVKPAAVAIYINEILEPPGFQAPNVYIELRGVPNSTIPAGTYLIGIEGDAQDNRGDVQNIFNLSGFTFGSNGYLVLLMKNNTYAVDPAASTVTASGTGTGYEGLPGFSADSVNAVEFAAVSFLLVRSANAPTLTDDIDSDNDGTADGIVHAAWTHLDSVGVLDGGSLDRSYAALTFALNGIGTASGIVASVGFTARYVGRNGDSTGSSVADWVAGGQTITGTAPNFTLSATNTSPSTFAGRALNHIGSTNFANGAPVNTVPGVQTVNEDTAQVFSTANGNSITVADPDAGSSALRVTLTATNGALTLSGIAGLTFTTGDGTDDIAMTFTGSAAAINTALNGLSFTPTPNFNGSASLTIDTNDLGNTGPGGAISDSDTIAITVNAVNDAPTFLATNPSAVNEDAGAQTVNGFATFSPGPATATDEATQTAVSYSATVTGTTEGLTFSSAPAIGTNGNLTYTVAANASGTATIEVRVFDSGSNTAPNVNTSAPQTFTITVNPVADTPSVTDATTNECTQTSSGLVITPNPVDSTEVTHYKITGITNGTLFQNDGTTAIVNGEFITVTQGNAGLKFTPANNFFGTGSFNVQGAVGNTGTGLSSAATATIIVNPINDEPTVTIGSSERATARVVVLDAVSGATQFDLSPFLGFNGGVAVAVGDVSGDGIDDVIAATATGASHVKVFDGASGAEIRSFFAFGGFNGGLSVASGDLDGDCHADIVVGVANGPTHVKAFSGKTGAEIQSFFAYEGFGGGVRVAVGDVNGDGRADVATIAGPGGSGHVKAFGGLNLTLLASYLSYPGFGGGINIAAGDVNGDGLAEIITTATNAQFGTHVKSVNAVRGEEVLSFFAPTGNPGEFRTEPSVLTPEQPASVGAADVTGDNVAEILLGTGTTRTLLIAGATQASVKQFDFDSILGLGVFVDV